MEAESSDEEKEGLEVLITYVTSGGREMDGGEGGGSSNNELDHSFSSAYTSWAPPPCPSDDINILSIPKSSFFLLCVIAGARLPTAILSLSTLKKLICNQQST